ncbi:MAG: hypothetical protein QOG26_1238 [Solirubrobacterales bacterium]|jgi:hypothetical protein|nr:hypothetical protein [Solirubrobacterales bacterium]
MPPDGYGGTGEELSWPCFRKLAPVQGAPGALPQSFDEREIVKRFVKPGVLLGAGLVTLAAGALGCGASNDPTALAVRLAGSGSGKMSAPSTVKGPLVRLTFTNATKARADAQLVRYDAGHTIDEVVKAVSSETPTVPDWLHGEGGAGDTDPGKSRATTLNLDAGSYVVLDDTAQQNGSQGKSPLASFKVTGGNSGDLPTTDATIIAAKDGSDGYKWEISGLKAGSNTVTFKSEGDKALHHVQIAPVIGNPTVDQIKKFFKSNGSGKPPVSQEGGAGTSVLDGGKSEVTTIDIAKPGRYAFICFLSDRDEKKPKPHFEEGLLTIQEVK